MTARLIALSGALCLAAICFLSCDVGETSNLAPGYAPPSFTLEDLTGGTVQLADVLGKVVLINFWASWCAPCVNELSEFEKLYTTIGTDQLEIIAIGSDDSKANLKAVSHKLQLSYKVVHDESGLIKNKFKVRGFPETFVVNKDGKLVLFNDPMSGPGLKVQGERPWSSTQYVRALQPYIDKDLQKP